jgi:hypothetical protein
VLSDGREAEVEPGASSDPRRRITRDNVAGAAAVGAGVAVVAAFGWAANSLSGRSSETDAPRTVPEPTQARSVGQGDLAGTIRAAADAASHHRRITAVDCMKPADPAKTLLVTCAVTFEGPACQLWLAEGPHDPEPLPVAAPADGRRGRANTRMAFCDG